VSYLPGDLLAALQRWEVGSKQCLDRRIADLKTLKHEVSAWENERNSIGATVRWQFKKDNARDKLQRHYQKLQN
ncbi:MAG TPA: hypothetical protein PKI26_09360, partial [Methanothrix sp.]|nr:hypothetical protein [Methanothrix sp.]